MRPNQVLWRLKQADISLDAKIKLAIDYIKANQFGIYTRMMFITRCVLAFKYMERVEFIASLSEDAKLTDTEIEDILCATRDLETKLEDKITIKKHLDALPAIEAANQNPDFARLMALRSGRDCYSMLKLPELVEACGGMPPELTRIEPDQQPVALRWILRGLKPDVAVKKVRQIAEFSHRVARQKILESVEFGER